MRIQDDSGFIAALELQRHARNAYWNASTPPLKKRLKKEYENVSAAIQEYVKNLKK